MSQWFVGTHQPTEEADFAVVEEIGLAMAQATISNAMAAGGITRAELARRLECPRSAVTRMLSGGHNLTVKTMSRALAACGFEPRFSYESLQWGKCESRKAWASETVIVKDEGRLTPSLFLWAARPSDETNQFPFGG